MGAEVALKYISVGDFGSKGERRVERLQDIKE